MKFLKGLFSLPIFYVIVFYVWKNAFAGDAPDTMSEEDADAAASFFAFFISFPFALFLSIVFANTNIDFRNIGKERLKKYLKYSAVALLSLYFTIYHPFWTLIGLYSLIHIFYFLAIITCVIFAYMLLIYMFPNNPIIRNIISLPILGFIGFDFFEGDFDFDAEASDISGAEGQTSSSPEVEAGGSNAIAEDTGITESNQGAPIDLDGDGEIDGFDINGDGSIDVNVVGVEVPNTEHVEGYVRESGTLVSPYVRTAADSIAVNNLEPTS